jgi:predicted ATPase
MRRFIMTGTPGAGKTAIIRQLELEGLSVVEEAATDVIAAMQARGIPEPWKDLSFIDTVLSLQQQRRNRASVQPDQLQFHDRSPICIVALSIHLGYPLSAALRKELDEIQTNGLYESRVFFIENLGFVTRSESRRISFEEAVRFEQIHKDTYRSYGFDLVFIKPGSVVERANAVKELASKT